MGTWHWDGREDLSTSYCRFLQQESHTRDITRTMSQQTARMIGSQEALSRAQIGATERGFDQLSDDLARQTGALQDGLLEVSWSVDRLGDRISGEIAGLRASFDWGFSHLLAGVGAMRDTLETLVSIAKTPAQTAAYEQFEIARDAFRQGLFPECLEALDRAVDGDQTSPGYKLEWRFHNLRGITRLGGRENHDPAVVDPAAAERAFLLAARYARADHAADAAVALLSASWAAWVQAEPGRSLQHAEAAIALDAGLAEALFQASRAQMALDQPALALPALRAAVDRDPLYLVKAGGDPAFQRHEPALQGFLRALHQEKARAAALRAASWLAANATELEASAELAAHPAVGRFRDLASGAAGWGLLDLLQCEQGLAAEQASYAALRARVVDPLRLEERVVRVEREVDEPCTVEQRYQDHEEVVEEEEVPRRFLFWTWTATRRQVVDRPVVRTRQVQSTRRVKRAVEERSLVVVDGLGRTVEATKLFTPVPAGRFLMGSPEGKGSSDEIPQHEVRIPLPFLMGTAPVTQAQWRAVMGTSPSHFKGDDRPVEQVSWGDAVAFCNKLSEQLGLRPVYRVSGDEVSRDPTSPGFRLPTEAEWEYAARAGQPFAYAGSESVDEVAWHTENSGAQTHPVCQKKPNAWGLYDMSGNVLEWVEDRWHANYDGAPTDGSAWLSGGDAGRVVRGGSWDLDPRECRAAYRNWWVPAYRYWYLGFRVLRPLAAPSRH